MGGGSRTRSSPLAAGMGLDATTEASRGATNDRRRDRTAVLLDSRGGQWAATPYEPFPGWVAVVQPGTEPGGDRVGLQVLSAGDPLVSYTVYVCGRHAYSGFF
jgi:hypothetical protein